MLYQLNYQALGSKLVEGRVYKYWFLVPIHQKVTLSCGIPLAVMMLSLWGVIPIGIISRAATGVKIFDRLKMALTA